jgi:uncharacterized protein (DUF1778 family)
MFNFGGKIMPLSLKSRAIGVRVNKQEETLIVKAATAKNLKPATFVRQAALARADAVLAVKHSIAPETA